jgi:hypothetical protein
MSNYFFFFNNRLNLKSYELNFLSTYFMRGHLKSNDLR